MRLPAELVLEIIEEAAGQNIVRHRGFVAALCRVCRSVQLLVEPILYSTVRLDNPAICTKEAVYNPRFARHTRRIIIRKASCSWLLARRAEEFPDFTNVEFLIINTSTLHLLSMMDRGMRLPRPKAMFLTSMYWLAPYYRPALFDAFSAVTHFALSYSGQNTFFEGPLPATLLKFSHVLLDISAVSHCWPRLLTRQVSAFLELPSLQRIVCRCTNATAALYGDVCDCLRELSDSRVAVVEQSRAITMSVPHHSMTSQDVLEQDGFEQDVLGGYDAWYSGTVLFEGISQREGRW